MDKQKYSPQKKLASYFTKASALEGRSSRAEGRRLVILLPFKCSGFNAPCSHCLLVFDCWLVRIPLQSILLPSASCLLPSSRRTQERSRSRHVRLLSLHRLSNQRMSHPKNYGCLLPSGGSRESIETQKWNAV